MVLVIAIIGCRRTVARMATVRATWASHPVAGVEIVYFVGSGNTPVPDWVTPIDAPDDYESLPVKVHRAHRWLSGRSFDWVLKCDDDTYLVIDRLLAELATLQPNEFLGSASFHPVFAQGGAGYLMHREASNRLAQEPTPGRGMEDVYFSKRLLALGYGFRSTPRLRYESKPDDIPAHGNDIISCHWMSPQRLRQLHDDLTGMSREESCAVERYDAVHSDWQGEILLFDDGFFIGGAALPDGLWSRHGDRLHLLWFSWPEVVLERTDMGWRDADMTLERRVAPVGHQAAWEQVRAA